MKIKMCGLQRKEDIDYVNKLKPDYVGFIFAQSKRQVSPHRAKQLIEKLDKKIRKVGVFVNESKENVRRIAKDCKLDILQFHGYENPEFIMDFKKITFEKEVWKSFSIKDKNSLKYMNDYKVDGYLLDTFVEGQRGGSGVAFNWDLVSHLSKEKFIILAGGLNIENIDKAIKKVKPQVLDISSGLEVNGYKDFNKMKAIMEKVRVKDG